MMTEFMWQVVDWAEPFLGLVLMCGVGSYVAGRLWGRHVRRQIDDLHREDQP